MTIEEIMEILPHRDPILLVDEVVSYDVTKDKEEIICQKFITGKEDIFNGHFPDKPIWPGVYILEGLAQSAGLLTFFMAERDGQSKKKEGLFSRIEEAKFLKLVEPDNTLIYTVKFDAKKKFFYFFECEAMVNNKRVASAKIALAIR